MPKRLPTKLDTVPLLEAVCELRVESAIDLHTILPGLFFSTFGKDAIGRIEQHPMAMNVPSALRALPQLEGLNSQLVQIAWGDYTIVLGTRNVVLAVALPYRGWQDFKPKIVELFRLVLGQSFVTAVQRYSIKYRNLVEIGDVSAQFRSLDIRVDVGPLTLSKQPMTLRFEHARDDVITIFQLGTNVTAELTATKEIKSGCIVDVDTICMAPNASAAELREALPDKLESIRRSNKIDFFDCLTDETIANLGAHYE